MIDTPTHGWTCPHCRLAESRCECEATPKPERDYTCPECGLDVTDCPCGEEDDDDDD